jgi:hypothetical protein
MIYVQSRDKFVNLFSPFFCLMILLPPENLQRKETKLVLFCFSTHFPKQAHKKQNKF